MQDNNVLDLTTVVCTRISNLAHVSALKRCIQSIQTFVGVSELTPIVIVDSDSPEKGYMEDFRNEKYIHVENIQNRNYEAGAWYHAYKKYLSKRYLFIHDNTYLTNHITNLSDNKISLFTSCNTWEAALPIEIDWVHKSFLDTEWRTVPNRFTMVIGSIFYCQRTVLEDLVSKGLFNSLPTNKNESQAFERYLGAAIAAAGYEDELLNSPRIPLTKEGFARQ